MNPHNPFRRGRVSEEALVQRGSVADPQPGGPLPLSLVASLLDTVDRPLLVAERGGRILFANLRAQQCLNPSGEGSLNRLNLFTELLRIEAKVIFGQMESGEHEINLHVDSPGGRARARIQWLPEPDWLVVHVEPVPVTPAGENGQGVHHTVQELLQEREITYRNLLAAYLRLQEVNRQKTVFLASAAHELKTPLAVIKGYYDLLLTGSLGKLSDKQSDILQESKESCERLVRLVSMFLNYSALESGKLILHLRENDLVECLEELARRWQEGFQRKQVRLETQFEKGLPVFSFDYQKVQQAVGNLLDNALKHTPTGGSVTLRARPHFWERRVNESAQLNERRQAHAGGHNSVEVAVFESGGGGGGRACPGKFWGF